MKPLPGSAGATTDPGLPEQTHRRTRSPHPNPSQCQSSWNTRIIDPSLSPHRSVASASFHRPGIDTPPRPGGFHRLSHHSFSRPLHAPLLFTDCTTVKPANHGRRPVVTTLTPFSLHPQSPPHAKTARPHLRNTVTLSASQDPRNGPSASKDPLAATLRQHADDDNHSHSDSDSELVLPGRERSPPPQYPASEAPSSPRPPPFSSLFTPPSNDNNEPCCSSGKFAATTAATAVPLASEGEASSCAPAYTPLEASEPWDPDQAVARAFRQDPVSETKHALPRDTKGESSGRSKDDDAEPPPAYSEGDSPLLSFSYVMAAAGGASSIITQVQQGGPPVNAIGGELPT